MASHATPCLQAKEDKATAAAAALELAKATDGLVDMRMDDPEVERMRQARLAALKQAAKSNKQKISDGHGELREIVEDDFLKEVTSTEFVVVHFFHEEFMTCKVMDKHLRALAPRCLQAKFLKLNAAKAAFFVAKIKVKVLPTLVFFHNGVVIGRQTGFEGLVTNITDEDFPTGRLLRVLQASGVLGVEARKDADGDASDEDDGSRSGGGGGAGEDFATKMARARRAMLESLDDDI